MLWANKLGITDSEELKLAEERISKQKAVGLLETGRLESLETGTFKGLSAIHRYLFEDIYEFAGRMRMVNITRGFFRFASVDYLGLVLQNIDGMPQSTLDEIIKKYIEMHVAHPFRKGNGRSIRIWLDLMLRREMKLVVDWSRVEKDDYLSALERCPFHEDELRTLLKASLTDRIYDRQLYLMGIDASYCYDGYCSFPAAALRCIHPG